jgi:hypothetical protein
MNGQVAEHEEGCTRQTQTRPQIVPGQVLPHIEKAKPGKYDHGEDFLNYFQLRETKKSAPQPIGRNLKTILEKGDAPTENDCKQEGFCAQIF